jgi:hypothetical protein
MGDGPKVGTVLWIVVPVAVIWYALKGLGALWAPAGRLVRHISPWTRALHAWVLSAPATFAYIAVFSASTLVQKTAPVDLIDLLTRVQSTNLVGLHLRPLAVLGTSAIWVADRGTGLILYVLCFGVVVAWAERRYGPPRIIVIGLSGHIFGSLLTSVVERHAIETGRAPLHLAFSTDVGVSYIMVAGCVAALILMRGWWLVGGTIALCLGVLAPVISSHTIWDLGHLLATLCGLVVAAFSLLFLQPRRPPRVRVRAEALAEPVESVA